VARAAYEKRINPYGMYRRSCEELDDFYAFYSIKAGAYLGSKGRGQFDSTLEKDTVTRIIGDAWRSLSATGRLGSLATKEKLKLFASWAVAFPSFGLERRDPAQVIQANFRRGSRQLLDDRCNCGSGLPYIRCCGRLSSPSEFSCE
jgi:hypothetical protein